jgi:hypothetical protein
MGHREHGIDPRSNVTLTHEYGIQNLPGREVSAVTAEQIDELLNDSLRSPSLQHAHLVGAQIM